MLINLEYRWKRKDGEYHWLSDSSVLIRDVEGSPTAIIGTARDVTARKEAEAALQHLERQRAMRNRIAEVFLTAPDEEVYADVLQIVLAVTESKHGLFGYVNEDGDLACPSMTRGIWDQCQMPDKSIVFARESWAGIWGRALKEKKTFYSDEPARTPEGHIPIGRVLAVPIVHQEDGIGLLVVANKPTDYDEKDRQLVASAAAFIAPILSAQLQRDVEEMARKQAEEALREQARRDPLTGILNHGAIVTELSRLVDSSDQTSQFAVAMVDVNGLKAINDRYGHQMGDAVLKAVARALSSEGVLVGRYGGDEFVSILPGANRRKAERYRREVVRVMAGTDLTEPESGVKVAAMASIGLAIFPQDAHTLVDLVKMSDSAMYAEKRRRPVDRAA